MHKIKLFTLLLILVLSTTLAQTKVGNVTLNNEVVLSGTKMILNGAGIREKMWIDLYVGALYLQTKSTNAQTIVSNDKPMAIKLEIVSTMVSQSKMITAINEGFEKSVEGKVTAAEKKSFTNCFKDEIVQGDIFDIVYTKGKTIVYKNGKEKGNVVGLAFKKALFGIWLGKKPADTDLKKGMLSL